MLLGLLADQALHSWQVIACQVNKEGSLLLGHSSGTPFLQHPPAV